MAVYLLAFFLTGACLYKAAYYDRKCRGIPLRNTLLFDGGGVVPTDEYVLWESGGASARKKNKALYELWFWLAVLPIFLITALRYDVGTDYFFTYVPEFNHILNGSAGFSEWGFNQLIRLIQVFTSNPQWLFVVTGFIFSLATVRTVSRCSDDPVLSVAVLLVSCFYFWSLNNVRQAIAAVLVFAAFPAMLKPNFLNGVRFAFFLALAFCFHQSVLIMALPFLVLCIKPARKYFPAVAMLGLILLPIGSQLAALLLKGTKYYYYFVTDYNNGEATVLLILYHLFFFGYAWLILEKYRLRDARAYVLLFMQYLCFLTATASLFLSMPEMISRLTMYFQVFQILLIPRCCRAIPGKWYWRALVAGIYIAAWLAYLLYFIVWKGFHGVLPYQWIFQAH